MSDNVGGRPAATATIRRCGDDDLGAICAIVNEAATAYAGVIPADRYRRPYMPLEELRAEIAAGVRFWGWYESSAEDAAAASGPAAARLVGVMGIQDVGDVTLIRHAYVDPACQRRGVGARLLEHLVGMATRPLLVGTWADAWWAVAFYQRHGFRLVAPEEKDRLLRRYWDIPARQVETSVVLREAAYVRRTSPASS